MGNDDRKLLLEESEFIIDEQLSRRLLSYHSYAEKPFQLCKVGPISRTVLGLNRRSHLGNLKNC